MKYFNLKKEILYAHNKFNFFRTNMAVDDELFEGDFENMQIRAEADVAIKENINLKHQIEKLQRQLSNLTKAAASSSSPSPQPKTKPLATITIQSENQPEGKYLII